MNEAGEGAMKIPAITLVPTKKDVSSIRCSGDILPLIYTDSVSDGAVFSIFTLDGGNRVIHSYLVSIEKEGIRFPIAEVFRKAMLDSANSIMLGRASIADNNGFRSTDLKIAQLAIAAGKVLNIPLLDFVVVAPKGHFSVRGNFGDIFA